jgi:cardiolipin synthase A/B
MSRSALGTVSSLARHLPAAAIEDLSEAAATGPDGLHRLRSRTGVSTVRAACDRLVAELQDGVDPSYLAGALATAGLLVAEQRRSSIDVVWTGPDSGRTSTRLTLSVIIDLIASAERELLLVSFAAHSDPHLLAALDKAASRGVKITLLLERSEDNPSYESWSGVPFVAVDAVRLAWPASARASGASLHAKFLVVDDRVALVGSANLTSRAMEDNLECGLLVRGEATARALRSHVERLRERGVLRPVRDSG